MTFPEMVFGAIVLTGFTSFIVTLAWMQFYTRSKADAARTRPVAAKAGTGLASAPGKRASA